MKKKMGGVSNKTLKVVFAFLCVLIVVLIIGVLVNLSANKNGNQEEIIIVNDTSAIASSVRDNIEMKMEEPNYNLSDAEREFESEIANSDPEMKVYLAIFYANFIYEKTGNVTKSIEILENINQFVNEQNRIDYYVALEYFYNEANNMEKANYYNELIEELVINSEKNNTIINGEP